MLQVSYIRENKEEVLRGLVVRNFANAETMIEKVISSDENRRAIQTELNKTLAASNTIAKEIGNLFKTGKIDEANVMKAKAAELKTISSDLKEQLAKSSDTLTNLLYEIPNIPNKLVPAGTSEEDNETTFEEGEIPVLHENAVPHWELAKNTTLLILS